MTPSSLKLSSIVAAASLAFLGEVVGTAIIPLQAQAADMLEDQSYEHTDVEFGTGWYLRGDVGGGLTEVSVETGYGSGERSLGTPLSINVGVGYTFAEGLRSEIGFTHYTNLDFTNGSTLMANVYADLGSYFGFRPYLGAGLGAAYVAWNDFNVTDSCVSSIPANCATTTTSLSTSTTFSDSNPTDDGLTYAASVMAGVSYELSRGFNLDVGYRFTYLGEAGIASALDNYGNSSTTTVGEFGIHEIRMGLRYEIW